MIPESLMEVSYKFRTAHRDDYYKRLHDDPGTSILFSSKTETFTAAFAIGFHLDQRKKVNADGPPINHANLSYISSENRELIITLMLRRFPDIQGANELWSIVEEYAEYGIGVLYNSIFIDNDGILDIDSLVGRLID